MSFLIILCLVVLATSKVSIQGFFAKKHITNFIDAITFNGVIFLFALLGFVGGVRCSLPVMIFGGIFGILTILFQACYIRAMSLGNVSVLVFIVNSSMIIPVLVSKICYNEQFGTLRVVGIVVVFIALILSLEIKRTKSYSLRWGLLSVASFLCNGGLALCQQIFGKSMWKGESGAFVAWSYLVATLISFAVCFVLSLKGRKVTFKVNNKAFWFCSIGAGVVLGMFQLLNTKAIASIDAGLLFPTYNGGTLVLSTLTGIYFLKDKLMPKQIACIVVGICGIIMINL